MDSPQSDESGEDSQIASAAAFYDDYWRGSSAWKPTDSLDKDLARWMRPLEGPGRRILDVGCGDGSRYARHLITAGAELHGVDVSAVAVEAACRQNVRAIQATLDRPLPYHQAEFDCAICSEVLQHLFDPELAAREIFRVLRSGGLLLATVPNAANWRSRFDMLFLGRVRSGGSPLNTRYPWRDPHLRLFNSRSIADMLKDVGFHLTKQGGLHTNFITQAPILRRMTLWKITRPLNPAIEAIGRLFPSLLAGRLVALAQKPSPTV